MADTDTQTQGGAQTITTEETGLSLLDQAISATKQTEPSRVEELMRTLANEAMSGAVQFQKNMTVTLREAIA